MINEVKFSKFVDTNEYVEEINLDELIKCSTCFINMLNLIYTQSLLIPIFSMH